MRARESKRGRELEVSERMKCAKQRGKEREQDRFKEEEEALDKETEMRNDVYALYDVNDIQCETGHLVSSLMDSRGSFDKWSPCTSSLSSFPSTNQSYQCFCWQATTYWHKKQIVRVSV